METETLRNHWIEILSLYEGVQLSPEPVDQFRRGEMLTLCDFLTGLIEQAEVQQRNLPGDNRLNCREPTMKDIYSHRKAEMAKFYHADSHWYCADFRNRGWLSPVEPSRCRIRLKSLRTVTQI